MDIYIYTSSKLNRRYIVYNVFCKTICLRRWGGGLVHNREKLITGGNKKCLAKEILMFLEVQEREGGGWYKSDLHYPWLFRSFNFQLQNRSGHLR